MIYWFIARMLRKQIHELPGQVCFMISGQDMIHAPDRLYRVTSWCTALSAAVGHGDPVPGSVIRGLTFHIATQNPEEMSRCLPEIRKIGSIYYQHTIEPTTYGLSHLPGDEANRRRKEHSLRRRA